VDEIYNLCIKADFFLGRRIILSIGYIMLLSICGMFWPKVLAHRPVTMSTVYEYPDFISSFMKIL
jgi:hypothetical protein